MNFKIAGAAGFAAVIALAAPSGVAAQEGLQPLAPIPAEGKSVSPFFEGWYANADGSYTLSFGYFNRNRNEVVEVPLGPENFVEPEQFNGMQPTSFPPVSYGGFDARRERGVFAVTIPAEFRDTDIVWTVTSNGETHQVPGRVTSPAYELSTQPMAMGSMPPSVMVEPNGAVGAGPKGIMASSTRTTRVGQPLTFTFWAADDTSDREGAPVPLGVTWWKHQGPGEITFSQRRATIEPDSADGESSTTASFTEAGDYIVRVRVDNHRARDSAAADQCCWSNGYFKVTVTQ